MKQDTLERPWELQSSTLSDSCSSKSQKHDLHVQTVPSTDKDFHQQSPQKRQHEPLSAKPFITLTYELKAKGNHRVHYKQEMLLKGSWHDESFKIQKDIRLKSKLGISNPEEVRIFISI